MPDTDTRPVRDRSAEPTARPERRRHARVQVPRAALGVSTGGLLGRWREAGTVRALTDLSLGGCRFRTDAALEAGDRLLIQLEVPAYRQAIRLRAVVVWRENDEADPGMPHDVGAQFAGVSEEARAILERLIDDGKLRTLERVTRHQDDAVP